MPPWPDWQFEYFGSRFLGKLLGLWSSLWVSLVRKLFRLLGNSFRNLQHFVVGGSSGNQFSNDPRPPESESSFPRKLYKMALSTMLTLGVWRIVTLKVVWFGVGERGERILAAILLLVSASWVISLGWICFSKPRRKKTALRVHPSARASYARSNRAKVS